MKIKKNLRHGTIFSVYLILYGLFRFLIEYLREPDSNIGYVIKLGKGSDNIAVFSSLLNISKGQVFCALMVLIGVVLLVLINKRSAENEYREKAGSAKKKTK